MALSRADVQRAFQNSLGREASQDDENAFVTASQSGQQSDAQLYAAISNSQEANLNTDPVVRFYQAAFGRVPDKAGLDNATDYIRANGATAETYQMLADMFVQSPEFQARFPGTGVTTEYVQALYSTILGRQASTAEIQGYVSGSNGYDTRGEVLYAISQSNEAIGRSDAAVNAFLFDAAEGDASYTGSLLPTPNPPADTTPPTVAISLADDSLDAGQTTQVTFDFSEQVTGFDLSDVSATRGTLSNLIQSQSDPTIYTATYTAGQTPGNGTIELTGAYTDVAGNAGTRGEADFTVAQPTDNGGGGGGGGGGGPTSSFSISDATAVVEGSDAVFTVTRSGDTTGAASVSYTTQTGSATNGTDFVAQSGVIQFAAGENSQTIEITTLVDRQNENSETFRVVLSAPSNGTSIVDASGTGTINDAELGRVRLFDSDGQFVDDFDTIQAAVDAAQSGYNIYATDGTFTGDVTINVSDLSIYGNGSPTLGTATGEPDVPSIIQGGVTFEGGATGARLDGFQIVGTIGNPTAEGATVFIGASDVVITNNVISPAADSDGILGVVTSGSASELTFTQNIVSGFETGIYLNPTVEGAIGADISTNTFANNGVSVVFEVDADGNNSADSVADNNFSGSGLTDIRVAIRDAGTVANLENIGDNSYSELALQVEVRASGDVTVTGSNANDDMSPYSFAGFYETGEGGVTLVGGAGNDVLHGSVVDFGTGPVIRADTLTGGDDADIFDFTNQGSSATVALETVETSTVDVVTDFTGEADSLRFDFATINYNEDTAGSYEQAFQDAQIVFSFSDTNVLAVQVESDVYVFTAENGPDPMGVVRLAGIDLTGISETNIINNNPPELLMA